MAKNFIKNNVIDVLPNTSDSHQTSPAWMLTVLTFNNPETTNPTSVEAQQNSTSKDVRKQPQWESQKIENANRTNPPIIITSDCTSLQISATKSSHNGTLNAILMGGTYNYISKIHPGDYVIANVLDYADELKPGGGESNVYNRALNGKPINLYNHGFKGVYRVKSIRKVCNVSSNGTKKINYMLQAESFSELNNSIYFNPYLASSLTDGGDLFYLTNLSSAYQNNIGSVPKNLQEIVRLLLNVGFSAGPNLKSFNVDVKSDNKTVEKKSVSSIDVSPNRQFQTPRGLGSLLSVPSTKTFDQLYRFLFGIQKYQLTVQDKNTKEKTISVTGYLPKLTDERPNNFYYTITPLSGTTTIRPEYFNQSTIWSIINSYSNAPINEMYTTFRLSPEGFVMPFLIFRQIPFNSERFVQKNGGTSFLSLPRWRIDPKMVVSYSVGRDDSARFNFVQVFGRPFGWDSAAQGAAIARQNASNNNSYADRSDILRSGLRPYVIQNTLDFPNFNISTKKTTFLSPYWSQLLGDAVVGGHMKLNGTIKCFGIEEPIAIGDNLEFEGVVYHIESVVHECEIESNGSKKFMTTIQVSHGINIQSNSEYTVYSAPFEDRYDGIVKKEQVPSINVDDNTDEAL